MTTTAANPLLTNPELPPFAAIDVEHIEPAVDILLQQCRDNLQQVLQANQQGAVTWQSLVAPLEEMDDRLNKAWSPVSHLHAVCNSDALREVAIATAQRWLEARA